ncbi:MAG: UDP-N-acetylglucosamine 1-carboxyvinyltransferase [Lachnospiraceae bacterium]|nr:UDP-N-acetylglucosamine 1-carboxyvinyltransferase [Lachnospiraceae bacterium]
MEKYIIKGGHRLIGEVSIGGFQNAELPIIAATLLCEEDVVIDNIPNVSDINIMLQAIEEIGAVVERISDHKVRINAGKLHSTTIDNESISKTRSSYYPIGSLIGRYKNAVSPLPGGCNIGSRPIDFHIKGFEALGINIKVEHGMIIANRDRLVGANVYFDRITVGATINVMMAAVLAEGTTVLENVAKEPHVVDVANFLNSMGANIKGAGTDVIRIKGVKKLHGTEYSVIPDQIEAGTFMMAAVLTGGDVTVRNVIPKHLESIVAKIGEIGCKVTEGDDFVRVQGIDELKTTKVRAVEYPGFPTDMQPQITVALCFAKGTSVVTETIFDGRFKYVDELAKMGATIKVENGNVAIINGVDKFTGAQVSATDLRAGVALVMAGLAAQGYTVIDNIEYIERGYENLVEKLRGLGALIDKVETDKDIQKFKLRVG